MAQIDITKAESGAQKAQADLAEAASAIEAANDKATALVAEAQAARERNDEAAGGVLLQRANAVARELVLSRSKYLKAVHVASFVRSVADLKQRAANEADPRKRAVLEDGAVKMALALKKFGDTPIKVKLPAATSTGAVNGLGSIFDSIGSALGSVGSFIKNNAGVIGTVAGTAAGAYLGGAQGAQLGAALGGTAGALIQGNQQAAAQAAPAPGAPTIQPGAAGAYNPAMAAAQAAGVPTGYGLPQANYGVPNALPTGVPLNQYANGYAQQPANALFVDPTRQLAVQPAPLLSPTAKTALYIGGGVVALGALGFGIVALTK